MRTFTKLLFFFTLLIFIPTFSIAADTLIATQSLRTNETLLSAKRVFELGFFNFSDSKWYLGVWYKNIDPRTVVWVANRDAPLEKSTGFLKFGNRGNIIISDEAGKFLWNSNETAARNPVLQLLDSGNLIIREKTETNPSKFLWQSFDYPTDTLLPGMNLGWNLNTGMEKYITSWKSEKDPSTGHISFKLEHHGLPEVFLWRDDVIIYRSGPWNGFRFSGVPEMESTIDSINFAFESNEHEAYYTFSIGNKSLFSRLLVISSGDLQRQTWIESSKIWNKFWYAPKDQCDNYKNCGGYGICDTNLSPVCKCVNGFRPKNLQAWNLRDGSDGCVRKTQLDCGGDKFLALQNVKLPDTRSVSVNKNINLLQCKDLCQKNCSCTAYANLEITNGGIGCVMWNDELIDIRQYTEDGQDLYVRLAASDVDDIESAGGSHKAKVVGMVVGISAAVAVILLAFVSFYLCKKRKLKSILTGTTRQRGFIERSQDFLLNEVLFSSNREQSGERNIEELELPLFDINTIKMATNNFSQENKLGQGGFGIVYRGRLAEGQEIAVKRLSRNSGQGIEEFKNEVKLLIKLQHRNLVLLFGCCIEREEKMLVYEYMENRSLDSFLFDKTKRSLLNWERRFNIICGIVRGLIYLHQDSRFKIIHRDLKASNILLDKDMNPKISDFGMARIFGTNQTEANTLRVVGTYGYMSPEYAMDGIFSIKSDVFSFGVLVLEIISGKKNRGFYQKDNDSNLLGHAWRLWKEGNALELLDPSYGDSYSPPQILRCIQVGLLCVQERAEDRPTMSSVVLMLTSENATMPQPKSPGFCLGRAPNEIDSSTSKQEESCTVNQVTVTMLDAR